MLSQSYRGGRGHGVVQETCSGLEELEGASRRWGIVGGTAVGEARAMGCDLGCV